MQRPSREEFILDVHRAARMLQRPTVEADSAAVDTDAISTVLHSAALWLTPKVVENYHPEDFRDWQADQQERLRLAIEDFGRTAGQVGPSEPPTTNQFAEGSHRFRELIGVLGEMVLGEWLHAIELLEKAAEDWSAEAGWRSRRVSKKISETLLGVYEAPQLLIFAEPYLYALDPLARFVPGGQGSFDFAIQPSYHMTSLYRDYSGKWHVRLDVQNGVSKGKLVEWNRESFRQCIYELSVLV